MKGTNFNQMKTLYKFLVLILFIGVLSACEKHNEMPPRMNNIIREYVLPEPAFLTNAEREEVNRQREEYSSL